MSGVDHLPSEEYGERLERSKDSRLCLRAHQHLVSTCPDCGKGWEELGPKLQGLVRQELAAAPPLTPPPAPRKNDLSGSDQAMDRLADQAASLRRRRRRAKKQLSELRRLPAARRGDKVRGAYRRFRSRMLAELLIEEAKKVVRNAPAEAESFASLVPQVLDWAKSEEHAAWAPTLVARATAHRANALRVAGELAQAEQMFARIDPAAIMDTKVRAEIFFAMGTLRSDQRRFEAAEELLQRAVQGYEYAGDQLGVAMVRIQQANLAQVRSDPAKVLELFEMAATAHGSDAPPSLAISTIAGRTNALCDLDRPLEAASVLHASLDVFEEMEAPFIAALLRMLEGRISMGLENFREAESYFDASIETLQLIGRPYDAASVSLFLAESLFHQGRTSELRQLATSLIEDFKQRRVETEALKALYLFKKAVAAETLSAGLLGDIRHRLLRFA